MCYSYDDQVQLLRVCNIRPFRIDRFYAPVANNHFFASSNAYQAENGFAIRIGLCPTTNHLRYLRCLHYYYLSNLPHERRAKTTLVTRRIKIQEDYVPCYLTSLAVSVPAPYTLTDYTTP